MKQFAVIGLGNFGYHVAVALGRTGSEVLAIDRDEKRVEEIKELVTQAVVLDATDQAALAEFVTSSVEDVVIGMGDDIEASIIVTLILKELGVKRIVAKAVSRQHARALELIGATEVIQPERDAALSLADRLTQPNILKTIARSPEYTIAEVVSPESIWGKTLAELKLRQRYNLLVIAVRDVLRNQTHIVPGPDLRIEPDSVVTVIGRYDDIARLTHEQ